MDSYCPFCLVLCKIMKHRKIEAIKEIRNQNVKSAGFRPYDYIDIKRKKVKIIF